MKHDIEDEQQPDADQAANQATLESAIEDLQLNALDFVSGGPWVSSGSYP